MLSNLIVLIMILIGIKGNLMNAMISENLTTSYVQESFITFN